MKKVANILARKGTAVFSVHPKEKVISALQMMNEKNIGSLVVKENEQYLGLLTERDYARKVILKGKNSSETLVEEIMSAQVPRVTPEDSLETCMQLMAENNLRYLPVFSNDQLEGIISINDVVRETILAQKETINHLHNYIHSS
jgi:CBS domain-containing protein